MNPIHAIADDPDFRWKALYWAIAQQTSENGFVAFLNNNNIAYPNDPFPNRLFVGTKRVVSCSDTDTFQKLYAAHREQPGYLVGYLGYDLKNELEALESQNPDHLGFPNAYFVEPEWVIDFFSNEIVITGEGSVDEVIRAISLTELPTYKGSRVGSIQCRVSSDEYLHAVRQIQQHILAGDVYELNYCIEFFAEQTTLDPFGVYRALNEQSPMPFSAFLKLGDLYAISASPERFLKKQGSILRSQPIKGTIRRGQTAEEDTALRNQLLNSEKERAENLMIVDLVRNDLARSAETGSVRVDELFGIYGFRAVYQLISTVSATLRNSVSWADAIRHAFPMGSMTGAPKIRSMELIDALEVSRRGVYSGAIGFITPEGDFDFSVVIRTLLYNARSQYASFSVGSAITYDADPEQEWEECLLKARPIRAVLEQNLTAT
ncbi:aminodeoxychorismate synthase component I [Spirosoma sp. SC4-14]|uniref:aminodeoxychorismate synthase component I n=1 Tax=Spirosoma sp. SC4-14 TaxID=3128900 RepID=UPI0030CAB176